MDADLRGRLGPGYLTFGWISDPIGRRRAFALYCAVTAVGLAVVTLFWDVFASNPAVGLACMFVAGVGTGTWSCYGPYFSELFPTRVRGAAMSVIMNVTRGVQFVAPLVIAARGRPLGARRRHRPRRRLRRPRRLLGVDPAGDGGREDRGLTWHRPLSEHLLRRRGLPLGDRRLLGQRRHRQRRLPAAGGGGGRSSARQRGRGGARGFAVLLLVLCFAEAASYFDRPGQRLRLHPRGLRRSGRLRGGVDDLARPGLLGGVALGGVRAGARLPLAGRQRRGGEGPRDRPAAAAR